MDVTARPGLKLGLVLVVSALLACVEAPLRAFSVLTHETIVDAVWDTDLEPLLRNRFPALTESDLRGAHAHAYGGCLIQDMGYYPFGSRLFTDLAHYVRSGAFVQALLEGARDANEYAFALGALAHYTADTIGHRTATNRAVPMLYPELERKYGDVVTYEENRAAHLKTEFGFDVAQVATGHFAPEAYHDFIGFEVSDDLLARAFLDTYGLPLKDLFASKDLAIGSYRRAVSSVIPEMTKVAWETKEKEIQQAIPGITREQFVRTISRASYEREWGTEYSRPGRLAKVLAFLFRLVPKIGPFKALAFRAPTPEVERLYMEAFNRTVARYRDYLRQVRGGRLHLDDRDLDTGSAARAGEYGLADRAFAELLHRLGQRKFEGVSSALRASILAFFRGLDPRIAARHDVCWKRTLGEIRALEQQQVPE